MNFQTFFSELKRRRVVRVAAVYAVVAFVLIQVADLLVPALLLPEWVFRFIVLLLILGFPVALVLAWAFDITPEGVVRTESVVSGNREAGAGKGPPEEGGEAPAPRLGSRLTLYAGVGLLGALGILLLVLRSGSEAPEEAWAASPSVAVLPFLNMSPDPDQEHFSDGITEDLITHLSRIEGLRVTSRTSVMRFKGSDLPIAEIARELGVSHVVEGSVRREGNEVRINAQLIDAGRDAHLWGDIYDRDLTDIFRVQSDITGDIARALEQRLSPGERSRIADGGTGSLTAYELLLRGRDYLGRPGRGDVRRYDLAISFFRQALDADPEYARAYSGLAEVYRLYVGLPAVPVRRDSILHYAGRAAALDPDLPEAVTQLGYGHLFDEEWEQAERLFRRALSLDGNQADAMEGMARLAGLRERLDEAARWQLRAVAVDPLSPPRLYRTGVLLFDLGDLEGAREAFRRSVALAPDYPEAALGLAWTHLVRGEEERADQVMRRLASVADDPGARATLGTYEGVRGRYEASEDHFREVPLAQYGALGATRAVFAKLRGDDERAAELMRGPEAMVGEWERQGYGIPPRQPLYRSLLRDDPEGVLAALRASWRTGLRWLEEPPQVGLYWIDQDPAVRPFRDHPGFPELLGEIRAGLDSMRALVDETLP